MSLIASKQKKTYRWSPGDLIGAKEAAELCGYKSANQFQDSKRRENMKREFETVGCSLTENIWIGGQLRFLRSEIDEFLTKKIEAALAKTQRENNILGLNS